MHYNNGEVIDFDILQRDKINAAREIAEGNSKLEKLLLLCFDNNIRTVSCCAHDAFIVFEINENNLDFHMKLKKILKDSYDFETISNLTETNNKIIYSIFGDDENIFEILHSGISTALQNRQDSISYYDVECAFALLNKIKDITVELPCEKNEVFYIQSQKKDKKSELEEFFFSENYYGNNLYVMDRTDIQNVLYRCYHNPELVDEKKGFLTRMLDSVFLNR